MNLYVEIGLFVLIGFVQLLLVISAIARLDDYRSLKGAYEQHREANRKAMRKLRKRVHGLEMVVKRGPTPVAISEEKRGIIKWGDSTSVSSEGCATSKSAF